MKKLISCLLGLLLLCCPVILAGCAGDGETAVTDTLPETTAGQTVSGPGFGPENHNGDTFTILLNNSGGLDADLYAEEIKGDSLNDATFNRLVAAQEYLGITFDFIREAGNWNSGMGDKIFNDVAANAFSTYDMVCMGLNTGIMGGYVDIYYNVNEMAVRLDNPWWVDQIAADASVNGRLITLSGDSMKSTYGYMGCVFANLQVAEDFRLGVDFYKLVNDREWTLDKFLDLQKNVVQELDGDNTITTTGDIFGWANTGISSRVMWSCANVNLISRDADMEYNWVESLDDRTVNFVKKLYDASNLNNTFYFGSTDGDSGSIKPFIENRCLYLTFLVDTAKKLTEMESHYAVLPMPLYDFNQEDYISANMSAFNTFFFPNNLEDQELSSKVADYFGWYGKERIIPQYYDTTLKFQYNNVVDNIAMLDLLREKLRLTANELFGTVGNGIGLTAMTAANTADSGFYAQPVSVWKNKITSLRAQLEEYLEAY